MEDYIAKGEEVAQKLQDYYKDKDSWTLSKKTVSVDTICIHCVL